MISIGSSAFRSCSGFNGSLVLPNTITSIADGLLDALTSLKEVEVSKDFDTSNLPDGVTVTIR